MRVVQNDTLKQVTESSDDVAEVVVMIFFDCHLLFAVRICLLVMARAGVLK